MLEPSKNNNFNNKDFDNKDFDDFDDFDDSEGLTSRQKKIIPKVKNNPKNPHGRYFPKFRLKQGFPNKTQRKELSQNLIDDANAELDKLPYDDFIKIDSFGDSNITPTARKLFFKFAIDRDYNDKKVFPKILLFLLACCILALTFFAGMGYYYNFSNPLIRLVDSVRKDYSINIIDRNNVKVFSLVSKSLIGYKTEGGEIVKDTIPNSLIYSLLSLHGILEDKKAYIPASPSQESINFLQRENLQFIKDITYKDKEGRKITCEDSFNDEQKFNTDGCKFSHYNFLIEYLLPNYASNDYNILDLIVNNGIHLSESLTVKLLSNWRDSNLTFEDFLEIYFNRLYYGSSIINLQFATKILFNLDNIHDLTIGNSIILVKQLYDNNKNIYPADEISYTDILDRMFKNNLISEEIYKKETAYLTDIELNSIVSPYIIYLDGLIEFGYKSSLNRQRSDIYTSFSGPLTSATTAILLSTIKKNNIPNASVVITRNDEIHAAYTLGYTDTVNEKNKPIVVPFFYPFYPDVTLYQSLKPFVYTAMNNAKFKIPTLLLENKYQNLIFNYRLGRRSYNREDYSGNSSLSDDTIRILNSGNLEVIPKDLLALFSRQLADSEYDLIKFLPVSSYKNTLEGFFGPLDKQYTSQDIANGRFKTNLYNANLAFKALFTEGIIKKPKYLLSINQNTIEQEDNVLSQVDNSLKDPLKLVFFNKNTERTEDVYYVLDYNLALAYLEPSGYTVAIWLGNVKDTTKRNNYVNILSEALNNVLKTLPLVQ